MSAQQEAVFDVFKQFGDGLTSFELESLTEGVVPRPKASALLSLFVSSGLAEKRGTRNNPTTSGVMTVYAPTGRAFKDKEFHKRLSNRGRRGPFESEVKDLRAWKAAAILRFPELGVDPVILKARAQVAQIMQSEGNVVKAAMIARGDLDDSEMMRVVISLLKGDGA